MVKFQTKIQENWRWEGQWALMRAVAMRAAPEMDAETTGEEMSSRCKKSSKCQCQLILTQIQCTYRCTIREQYRYKAARKWGGNARNPQSVRRNKLRCETQTETYYRLWRKWNCSLSILNCFCLYSYFLSFQKIYRALGGGSTGIALEFVLPSIKFADRGSSNRSITLSPSPVCWNLKSCPKISDSTPIQL